jgi:hypothetical protein
MIKRDEVAAKKGRFRSEATFESVTDATTLPLASKTTPVDQTTVTAETLPAVIFEAVKHQATFSVHILSQRKYAAIKLPVP